MLEQHGGGDGIDISLASAGGSTHLAHGAKSGGGGEPLVHETHGKAGSFLQLGRDVTDFGGAGGIVAVLVERQTDDEALSLELGAATNHLRDRRPLSGATGDEADRGGDGSGWIAHGEADATVTVIDS
jgi:hypothetical protein